MGRGRGGLTNLFFPRSTTSGWQGSFSATAAAASTPMDTAGSLTVSRRACTVLRERIRGKKEQKGNRKRSGSVQRSKYRKLVDRPDKAIASTPGRCSRRPCRSSAWWRCETSVITASRTARCIDVPSRRTTHEFQFNLHSRPWMRSLPQKFSTRT